MAQYLVLIFITAFCGISSFWWTPYAGVALYYFFAVLRPQYLWKWQLDSMPVQLPWSFLVAGAAIGGYLFWSIGLLSFGRRETSLMRYRPKFTIAHWMMMLFAFWVSMSYLLAKNPDAGEVWYGEYIKIFTMYYLASRVVRTPTQLWGLYLLVLFALFYISFEANMEYLKSGRLMLHKRGYAGLDNNGVALMLCLGVPLCYFAWEATRGVYRWGYLLVIPSIIHAVLGTYSRGGMLAMLAASVLYFVFSRKKKMLIFLGFAVALMLPFMAGKEIQDRFFSIEQREADASYQSRLTSWRIAWEIANEYPVFGVGVRNSGAEMKERGADMEGRTIHSQYLQLAADSGMMCMFVYIGVIVTALYCGFMAFLQLRDRSDYESVRARAMLGGVICGIVSCAIGAFALSLEVFEVSYLLLFLAAQTWGILNAKDTLPAAGASPWGLPGYANAHGRMPIPQATPRPMPQPMRHHAAHPMSNGRR
jgi:probable O-glycosylation ligase (exosortase A-associated)